MASQSNLQNGLVTTGIASRPRFSPMPWMKRADLDGLAAMLAQNFATMLLGCQMLRRTFAASGVEVADDIVYKRVLPAMGLALFLGGMFYALQAQGAARATGRTDFCSQPFGISTPGVFVFTASIIVPVYASTKDAELAWQLGCLANLVQGMLEVVMSIVGPYILQAVSVASLLVALANIGFPFLLAQPLQTVVASPVVGFIPLFILMLALLANVKIPKLPVSVVPLAVASAVAWSTGHLTAAEVRADAPLLGLHLPCISVSEVSQIGEAFKHINIIIPVALTASIGTLMCQQLAASAGDDYSVRTTMIGDGLVTTAAALCGCPFGFTVYVGHPAMKQMGCSVGYNIMTGVVALALCCSGVAAMLLTLVPIEAFDSFVIFVGIILCVDALQVLPDRHWPAFIVGLVPGICAWCVSQAQSFAEAVWPVDVKQPNFTNSSEWKGPLAGLYAMSSGYIVTAMCWCSIFISFIDRRFAKAAAWCMIASLLSAVGLIHASELSLPWEHSLSSLQVQLAIAYASCGALFGCVACGQLLGWVPSRSLEEEANVVVRGENDSFVTLLERRYENKVTVDAAVLRRTF
eukprot:TRINITY_DN76847_c0_g1_i1.p1 TRINITY_DN76847_c0_g1~~TRINITY_DN76847_c0_g1_i1.p1  ORF type:complete len:578 (+),score=96.41 TRINITY_DN76847_c0_g1_i1:84-1817(+)